MDGGRDVDKDRDGGRDVDQGRDRDEDGCEWRWVW